MDNETWLDRGREWDKIAAQCDANGDRDGFTQASLQAIECRRLHQQVIRALSLLDGFAETRAQLDELAQQAEGSHRQHMGKCDVS